MTHQTTRLNCSVGLKGVGVCVIGLQLDFPLNSSLIPDRLVGSRPPYDSLVGLVDVSWPLVLVVYMRNRLGEGMGWHWSGII